MGNTKIRQKIPKLRNLFHIHEDSSRHKYHESDHMASKVFASAQRAHRQAEQEYKDARRKFDRTTATIKNLHKDLTNPDRDLDATRRSITHYSDVLRNQKRDCDDLKEAVAEAHATLKKAHEAYKAAYGTPAQAEAARRAAQASLEAEAERDRVNAETRRERFEHTTPREEKESAGSKPRNRKQKSPTKPRERKGKTPKAVILEWRVLVDQQLSNYATMTVFPSPPSIGGCLQDACVAKARDRVSIACDCQIAAAFDNADVKLKVERLRWHPDKFSACAEEKRKEWVEMAGEVFRVVNGMYEAEKGEAK